MQRSAGKGQQKSCGRGEQKVKDGRRESYELHVQPCTAVFWDVFRCFVMFAWSSARRKRERKKKVAASQSLSLFDR
jgi:hypothetical protein